MPEKIEPALSETEWAERGDPVVSGYIDWGMQVVDVRSGCGYGGNKEQERRFIPGLIALANAALPDSDPRKITREKITALRSAAHFLENADGRLAVAWSADDNPWHKLAAELRATADALESYLRQEGT